MDTDLATNRTLAERVEMYQEAVANIREAYAILAVAQKQLEAGFGAHYHDFEVLPCNRYYSGPLEALDAILDKIKRCAWKHLINLSSIRKVLSVKRAAELDKKLEYEKLDEITHENVIGMIDLLRQSGGEFASEAAKEVYDFLRPGAYSQRYKTNQANARWRLGKKIILPGAVCENYSGRTPYQVEHYRRQNLVALDRVFHMLDGKGIPDGYASPLVDAIDTSASGGGETTYFKFQGYRNNNLHLEFRRLDLVSKLNQICGGGTVLHD